MGDFWVASCAFTKLTHAHSNPKDRKPLIISGLESILGVPEISLASALSQLNAQTTGSDSEDDDLMESLPLAAARVLDQ